jgi:hypothetical protein
MIFSFFLPHARVHNYYVVEVSGKFSLFQTPVRSEQLLFAGEPAIDSLIPIRGIGNKACLKNEDDAEAGGHECPPHTCLGCFWLASALSETFDQQVEHGDKKQVEDGAHDHAPENGGAYGVAAIFSSTGGEH